MYAIGASNENENANDFVLFMLEIIKSALEDILMNAVDVGENVGENVGETEEGILNLLDNNPRLSAVKIADNLNYLVVRLSE